MLGQLKEHIENNFQELLEKPLLLAVSGGIDSVVLVHLCHQLKLNVAIAHCNFHLRKQDSIDDQAFVEQLGNQLSIPVYVAEFQTEQYANENKISIQIAARKLRYDWFKSLITEGNYRYLLTAHHLDDSMETFLINLSRGTGIEGLLGIPAKNDYIRRPLLPFTREQIAVYAEENNIIWREDYTNAQTKYLRNKIRKNILPLLKETNDHFTNSFQKTVDYLQQTFVLSEDASKLYFEKIVKKEGNHLIIDILVLKELSSPIAYLYRWLQPYGFTAWSDIEDLLGANSGKIVYSATHLLLKNRDELILQSLADKEENKEQIYFLEPKQTLTKPVKISITPYEEIKLEADNSTIYVDGDSLKFPLSIRKYRSGDKFIPFGMKGNKKVSKFFKDEKFSLIEKENTWLLCSEDKIVWIIGSRMDERFKIKNTTTNIFKIQVIL